MPIISEVFHVDSHNRLNKSTSSHSDFDYSIDFKGKPYTHACVLSAAIPKSYYLIQSGFQTFTLTQAGVVYTIVIPVGNYSATEFITILLDLLNANPNNWVYTMTLNRNTAKYTWVVTGNSAEPIFTFEFNVFEQMGFDSESVNVFSGGTLESVDVIDFAPENTLYLRSNISQTGKDNILQEIYGSGIPPYGLIQYYLSTDFKAYSKPISTQTTSNTYHFTLTNEDDEGEGLQILNTNGKNIVFALLVWYDNHILEPALRLLVDDVGDILTEVSKVSEVSEETEKKSK